MRLGGSLLADARSNWIRQLARSEQHFTDVGNPGFWIVLFVIGIVFKFAFDYAQFRAEDADYQMRTNGMYILGAPFGSYRGARYLRRIWTQVAWVGPIATTLPIASIGVLYSYNDQARLWPVMVILILYSIRPILDFLEELEAVAAMKYVRLRMRLRD